MSVKQVCLVIEELDAAPNMLNLHDQAWIAISLFVS